MSLCGISSAQASCALAQYGTPKYAADFQHFAYVNPQAPKGGTLTLANPLRLTSFDKFNPFTLRGNLAPGIGMLMESLATANLDEPATVYCLLADDMRVADDYRSISFHLNPRARFSNGDPVTAADVRYTFETLRSAQAAPQYRAYLADIERLEVLDAATVRFVFRRAGRDLPLLVASLPIFSQRWGRRADGTRIPLDQLALEAPLGSGPYVIEQYDGGTTIRYRRNPNYWGAALPVRVGTYNFDHIVYKLYADQVARREAFKAGEYDVMVEMVARDWQRFDTGKRFERGELIKRVFRNYNGAGLQGFYFNLRKPLFRDVRVRQALTLAFDFEWLNRRFFYGAYTRLNSNFVDTDWQARGMPGPGELALLEPWRAQLDPAVFGLPPVQPNTDPPQSLRANLLKARDLLAQAGWTYRDGALRNAQGTPFVFEFLDDTGSAGAGSTMEGVINAYQRNLAKLGIVARLRTADFALLQKRFDAFDFDMAAINPGASVVPGNEQVLRWDSRYADQAGSDNFVGTRVPAIDALLQALVIAQSYTELRDAARALDRVLMHGNYLIPAWYSNQHRIAYQHTLAYPSTMPLYYGALDWVITNWWVQSPH